MGVLVFFEVVFFRDFLASCLLSFFEDSVIGSSELWFRGAF